MSLPAAAGPSQNSNTPIAPVSLKPDQLEAYHRSVTNHVQQLLHAARGLTHRVLLENAGPSRPSPPAVSRNGSGSSSTDISLVSSAASSSQPATSLTSQTSYASASSSSGPASKPVAQQYIPSTPRSHAALPRQPSNGFIHQRRASLISVLSRDSPSTYLPPDMTARPLIPEPVELLVPVRVHETQPGPSVPLPIPMRRSSVASSRAPRHTKSLDDMTLLQNLSPPTEDPVRTREEEQKDAWNAAGSKIWRQRPSFELKLVPKSRHGSLSSPIRPDVAPRTTTGRSSSPLEEPTRPSSPDVSHLDSASNAPAHAQSHLGTSHSSSHLAPEALVRSHPGSSSRPSSRAPTSLRDPSEGDPNDMETYETRRQRRLRKHQDALCARIEAWYGGVAAEVSGGQVYAPPEIPLFVPSPSLVQSALLASPWQGEGSERDAVRLQPGVLSAEASVSDGSSGRLLRGSTSTRPRSGTAAAAMWPPRPSSVPPSEGWQGRDVRDGRTTDSGAKPSVGNGGVTMQTKRQLPLDLELAVRLHTIEGLLGAANIMPASSDLGADFLFGDGQTFKLGQGGIQDQDGTITRSARH